MNYKKIHFIGIGGISMSALATFMHLSNYDVQGSDLKFSSKVEKLRNSGIKVFIGHDAKNLENVDLCVFTGAIDENNVELSYAIKNKIPIIERSKFLNLVSEDFQNTIAVSGSHGKTTTTAMISKVFLDANLHPTIHLGGEYDYIGGNFKFGDKKYFITEACEYRRSFLELSPQYSLITNVELDHVDCYQNLDDIYSAFNQFITQTNEKVFINVDTEFFKQIEKSSKIISYGTSKKADYHAYNFRIIDDCYIFDVEHKKEYLLTIKLNIVGYYNAINALACVAVCHTLGINCSKIKDSLQEFKNVARRFEFIKKIDKMSIYKDYAHHPTEIKNVLKSAKSLKYEKVICFFQPHTYTRTLGLFYEFLDAFVDCDELYLLPTYPAREEVIIGGRSEDLFDAISKTKQNVYFIKDFEDCSKIIKSYSKQNCIILLLGAGDIQNIEYQL